MRLANSHGEGSPDRFLRLPFDPGQCCPFFAAGHWIIGENKGCRFHRAVSFEWAMTYGVRPTLVGWVANFWVRAQPRARVVGSLWRFG